MGCMKCASCDQEVHTTFLDKVVGTYVKKDGVSSLVCDECQRAYSHDELLARL